MFTLTITTTDNRFQSIIPVTTTVREALSSKNIDVNNLVVHIAGTRVDDLNSTFADLGIAEDSTASMTAIVKMNGAA